MNLPDVLRTALHPFSYMDGCKESCGLKQGLTIVSFDMAAFLNSQGLIDVDDYIDDLHMAYIETEEGKELEDNLINQYDKH